MSSSIVMLSSNSHFPNRDAGKVEASCIQSSLTFTLIIKSICFHCCLSAFGQLKYFFNHSTNVTDPLMWILFFRGFIQIHAPASREVFMNNYYTLCKHTNTFAVYRSWELPCLCCLLVYEQHFARQSLQPLAPSTSQEYTGIRMPLLHTLKLFSNRVHCCWRRIYQSSKIKNKYKIHSLFCHWDLAPAV